MLGLQNRSIIYISYIIILSTVEEIDRRCSCGPLSGRRNFDRRSNGARVRASVESTVKRPKRIHSIRGYVESFENSSFTRPSGGVFEVKLAQHMKNEKVVCGSLLEFHFQR